uniref:Uncharacterized protein n=1 Tax=Glossina morsitans morsitans TaxID=37546 RepID=A0A1B0GDT6_GLOMM
METSVKNENTPTTRVVKEMVQNSTGKIEGKTFLCKDVVRELNNNDYRPIQRVFFFLFNYVLTICKVKKLELVFVLRMPLTLSQYIELEVAFRWDQRGQKLSQKSSSTTAEMQVANKLPSPISMLQLILVLIVLSHGFL